jgi:ribosome biogenesis GTPase
MPHAVPTVTGFYLHLYPEYQQVKCPALIPQGLSPGRNKYIKHLEKGIVIKSTGSWYTVRKDGGICVACKLKGRLRTEGIKSTSPVAVGDRVLLEDGMIRDIEPRRNYIIRKSTNLSKQSHIIAANVDMAFLAVTFRLPETPVEFIDRFLVAAEAYRIPVCLIFNKIDLFSPKELVQLKQFEDIYRTIGCQTVKTSVTESTGIDQLRRMFAGKVSVVAGLSGTGKSSLINAVDPGLQARVGGMSGYHQSGRHTTTFAEMFSLQGGGYIIDTPGIRGFGLIHIEKEELYHFFPEIFKVSAACAFHNCRHINEPGCAVMEAAENGKISPSRYRSYLNMMEDEQNKYR